MPYAGDVRPAEAWTMLAENDDAVLVDVRTVAEWTYVGTPDLRPLGRKVAFIEWVGYPDGVPNADFMSQLEAAGARPGSPVIMLCRSGVRSVAAAQAATAAGYSHCYNVLDGFEGPPDSAGHRNSTAGWRAEGLPWVQR